MTWLAGKQLKDGRYTVEKVLGRGGFGVTYLAKDNNLSRNIVIKTLNEKLQYDPEFARVNAIFEKEAKIISSIEPRHPHIVQIYDIFQENQMCCMVIEYIPGSNLFEIVDKKGALPEAEALRYILQIGDALITVHQHGLLHRDINPRNIILRAGTSEAVLIDFGIAREFKLEYTTRQLTISQGYSPAELYSSQSKMGFYSDVYSLAATLYFLLTKTLPVSAIDRIIMENKLIPPNELNTSISDRVTKAIMAGMSLKAESRPQSMQEWLELLGFKIDKDVTSQSRVLERNNLPTVQTKNYFKNHKNKFLQVESLALLFSLISFFVGMLSLFVSLSESRSFIDKLFPTSKPTENSQPNK